LASTRSIEAPVLLIHGTSDSRVQRLHSDLMVSALRQHGRWASYLVLPAEGHGFQNPGNRLRLAASTEVFLATVLGGRLELASPQDEFRSFMR
jgi:dipeptidyl aminopeptidase/acylaminoacyl peptidase